MADVPPSPLSQAIESMSEAARAFLDGPVAFIAAAADRAARPGYGADAAAADAAGYSLRLAQAFWQTANAATDAVAILALPPGDGYRFTVSIPPIAAPTTVRIVDRVWTWNADPEPDYVEMLVLPPVVLLPPADSLVIHVTPLVLVGEPSWRVVLELTTVGSTQTTTITRYLNDPDPTIVG